MMSDAIKFVEFTIIPEEKVRVLEWGYDSEWLNVYYIIFEVLKEGPFTVFAEADDWACAGPGANDPPVNCFINYEAAECFTDKDLELGSDQICPNAKTTATLSHCICGLTNPEAALEWTYEVASGDPGVKVEIIRDTGADICERKIIAGDKTGEVWIIAKYEDCEARQLLKIGCSGCDSGSCSAGSGNAKIGSVDVRFNLGTGPGGDSAGHLGIFAEQPGAALATPRVLRSNISADLTFEYRDPTTEVLLQVLAPQVFVEVVYGNPDVEDYQLYFYSLDQLLSYASTGPWSLISEPQAFLYWHIENPSAPGVYDGIKLSRYVDNGSGWTLKQVYEYSYAPYTDPQGRQGWIWTLTTGDGATTERTETDEWVWDTGTLEWLRTYAVQQDGGLFSKVAETWDVFAWGKAPIDRTVDPDGLALVTTFDYYDNGSTTMGRLKSRVNPDNSWVYYTYDGSDRVDLEVRSYLDDAMPATPTQADARSFTYTYDSESRVTRNKERLRNVIVTDTEYDYDFDFFNVPAGPRTTVIRHYDLGGTPQSLATATTYDPQDENKVLKVVFPDGRSDEYNYLTTPVAGPWDAEQLTIEHYDTAGNRIPRKSTADVTKRDERGLVVETDLLVSDGPYYPGLNTTTREYDSQSRLIKITHPDGTQTNITPEDCCSAGSTTDPTGVTTQFVRNSFGRLVSQTRALVPADAGMGFPSQPAITTSNNNVADGSRRTLTTTVTSSPLSMSTIRAIDLAGRVREETDAANLETAHVYDYGTPATPANKVTTTFYNGSPKFTTRFSEYYLDGRVKSVTGTAVVEQFYEYGTEASGYTFTKVYSGPGGSGSLRWTKTVYDELGRVVSEERQAYSTGTVTSTSTYDNVGYLTKTITPGLADTLYEYDTLGNQTRSGLDVDGNGALDPGGTDRMTDTDTAYEFDGEWWITTSTTIFTTDGNQDTVTTSSRRRLTGLDGVTIGHSETLDARANVTTTTRTLVYGDQRITEQVDYPDSANTSINYTRNGLLQRATTRSNFDIDFLYDNLGRRTDVEHPRSGGFTVTAYDSAGRAASVTDPALNVTTYAYDPDHGRLSTVTNADTKKTYYEYDARGQVLHVWGDVPQPAEIGYDGYGQRTTLRTYRGGSGWAAASWPGTTGDDDLTTWQYHAATGLLENKTYDDGKQIRYEYTAEGRLLKRHWARDNGGSPLLTTYSYDGNTGELTDIVYADGTHGVTFEYTRAGLIDTVDDELGGHTFAYTAYLEPLTETIDTTGILSSAIVLTRAFETTAVGRLNDLQVGTTADPDAHYQANYYYESATARMSRVTGPGLPSGVSSNHGAWYAYKADSDLLDRTEVKNGSGTLLASATRAYEDDRDLLKSVENKWEPTTTTLSKYEYAYDVIGRPEWVVRTGTAFAGSGHTDLWDYDDRSELTDAKRYDSGTAPPSDPPPNPDTAKFFNWLYDNAGNRSDYDVGSPATEQTDYFANALNQYTWTDYDGPGADARQSIQFDADGNLEMVYITGDMNCDGVFDVDDVTAFYLALGNPVQYEIVFPTCNILNGDINGDGVLDAADEAAFWALYASGNGGLWQTHVWNAENRLIAVEPAGAVPTEGVTKVAFAYDYMGRRIEKKVWQDQESTWVLIGHTKFIYDGWLLLLELDGLSGDAVLKKYTWGLDLSSQTSPARQQGSIPQGAGGIGGLLATHVVSGAKDYMYYYDNLGNVGQMTDLSGTFVAKYEYNAYGGVQTKSGSYAGKNPFRFSTKYFDDETGLVYWGFRYYSPSLGRWLNRDPLDESGHRIPPRPTDLPAVRAFSPRVSVRDSADRAAIPYGFVQNRPVDLIDPTGEITVKPLNSNLNVGCGAIASMAWDFELDNPAPCDGYIVQEVEVRCKIKKCGGCPDTTPRKPSFTYLEAWFVKKGGTLPKTRSGTTFTDRASTRARDKLCGLYSQMTTIKFFCKKTTGNLDNKWRRGSYGGGYCRTSAGSLPSTANRPTWFNKEPVESTASRNFSVYWNCCGKDKFVLALGSPQ